LSIEDAAAGIVEVADNNMAGAMRTVSVGRGLDPKDFALVAFGGAGPLHAGGIIEKMGMTRIVIPIYPGLCSAFGAAIADFQVDKVWSTHYRSDSMDADVIVDQFRKLATMAREELHEEGFTANPEVHRSISMRYAGQNYEHDVTLQEGAVNSQSLGQAFDEFHRLHEKLYGYSISGEVIELIRISVTAIGRTRKPRLKTPASNKDPQPRQTRPVYFDKNGFVPCPVYYRDELPGQYSVAGPAVIEEVDSTILLHPGHTLQVNRHGVIGIRI
jgi:N-methylhydantoinase A